MTSSQPARTPTRRIPRALVAGLLVVSAAVGAVLGYELKASSTWAAASPIDALKTDHRGAAQPIGPDPPRAGSLQDRRPAPPAGPDRSRQQPDRTPGVAAPAPPGAAIPVRPGAAPGSSVAPAPGQPGAAATGGADPRDRLQRGASGEADGVVPDGTTVFDDELPGVARLDPALLNALRRAATAAANDRVTLYVTSGWRSPKYQEQLLREAISEYGSAKKAARWVATAKTSPHVSGDAVDVGPADALAWLSRHGATYGLCRVYGNEPWHYELRPDAIGHGCPPMYADPTRDPRMQT